MIAKILHIVLRVLSMLALLVIVVSTIDWVEARMPETVRGVAFAVFFVGIVLLPKKEILAGFFQKFYRWILIYLYVPLFVLAAAIVPWSRIAFLLVSPFLHSA